MATSPMAGAGNRLEFVIRPIAGTVKRYKHSFSRKGGLQKKLHDQPAGFMVYFPQGHILRFTEAELVKRGFATRVGDAIIIKEPKFVNMADMNDPNSPLGKLFMAQDDKSRSRAFTNLEQMTIELAAAKTGVRVLTINPETLAMVPEPQGNMETTSDVSPG